MMDVLFFSLLFSSACAFNLNTDFPIIFKGASDSYFGYSVALHRNRDGPVVLVGAPRSNSSVLRDQLYQPGAVFRCDMKTSCVEVVLDKKGNTQTEDGRNNAYHDKKDSMWLGVSLDVQHKSSQNNIVACGHLWKNQLYSQHYLANGACYIINGDLDSNNVTKLVPFVKKSKQAIIPPGIYYYAFGQVGASASFSEDGSYLHLGAPGFYDWTGTVVSYNLRSAEKYRQPYIPDPPEDQNRTPESYIGYSVTSGKFFDGGENYIAVGAPRDGEFKGRVYIYKVQNISKENNMIVYQQKNGLQLGEYFGASVLAINLNDDSYTDLIVAAPLHSVENGVDEGKVYIFISNGLGLQTFAELYGRKKMYARFGSSVAHLGDINQDGYNDIAIGAPYEDEKGAIYIYHGTANGLNSQFAQRVAAKDIDSSLNGFGIHISKGFDIDSNQYPDVLVGAYSSANAVLFRTQPVIQVTAKLSFFPKQINTNVTNNRCFQGDKVTCVNMTACLWYAGKHVPLSLEFENVISLDHPIQGSRGFYFIGGSPTLKKKTKLEVGVDMCITEEIYIQTDIKGVTAPLQVLYKYDLIPDVNSVEFRNTPIIDPSSARNISSSISFVTGCGTDDKCFSDLVVSAKILGHLQDASLVIGRNSSLSILIEISNIGEPAYLAEMTVTLPSETPSINQDICSAKSGSENILNCDLGNPLLKGKPEKILIKLDMTKIPVNKKQIVVSVEARTASFEVNPIDNKVILPLNLTARADISITGISSHEQIPFDDKIENVSLPLLISHTYFIMNHGPSSVSVVDISLHVPISFNEGGTEITFASLRSIEEHSEKPITIPAKCNVTNLIQKTLSVETKKEFSDMNQTSFFDVSEFQTTRNKRNIKEPPKMKNDVFLDCKTSKCVSIHCSASPFSDVRNFAKIVVTVQMNVSLLNEIFVPWHKIEFITNGVATIRGEESSLFPKHTDETKVKTVVVHSGPPAREKIAHWIIFVSIGVGVLLLLIILFSLIKFGFFRRMQKEKMEELKTKDDFDDEDEESR